MRGQGSIVWAVVPFHKAKEFKVGRSYEFLVASSRFMFLSNRGALMMSTAKASSMRDVRATVSARLNSVKRSRFLDRKMPPTH